MISKLLAGSAALALSVGAGQAVAQQATVGAGAHTSGPVDPARGSTSTEATASTGGSARKPDHGRKPGDPVTSTLGHTGGLIGSTVGGNLSKGAGLIGGTVGGALGVGRRKPQSQPQS